MVIAKTKMFQSATLEELEEIVNEFLTSCYIYLHWDPDRHFELIDIKFTCTEHLSYALVVYKTDYRP